MPEECPRHPGEKEYDQSWIRYLISVKGLMEVLGASLVAGVADVWHDHLRGAVRILEARGFGREWLTNRIAELALPVARVLPRQGAMGMEDLLEGGMEVVRQAPGVEPSRIESAAPRQMAFLATLLSGNRPQAVRLIDEALGQDDSWLSICTHYLELAQEEVGRLWAQHRISVLQEHMATAVAELALSHLSFRVGAAPGFRTRGRAVVTGLTSERHQLGGLMVADMLESEGWEIRYLGSAAPMRDLLRYLVIFRPRLLCISVTLPNRLPLLVEVVRSIRAEAQLPPLRILLGGQALRLCPALAIEMGADGVAGSLQQGLDLLQQWNL